MSIEARFTGGPYHGDIRMLPDPMPTVRVPIASPEPFYPSMQPPPVSADTPLFDALNRAEEDEKYPAMGMKVGTYVLVGVHSERSIDRATFGDPYATPLIVREWREYKWDGID